MKLERLKLSEVTPYVNNPRKNDDAVNAVAESIRQCSYILNRRHESEEEKEMLYLHTRLHCHAGGGLQSGSAERAADKVRGISGNGSCPGILRCRIVRKEHNRQAGVHKNAAGYRGKRRGY